VSRSLDSITAITVGLFVWLLMTTLKHVNASVLQKGSSYSSTRICNLMGFGRSRNRPELCFRLSHLLSGVWFITSWIAESFFIPELNGNRGFLILDYHGLMDVGNF
jgi:hypothetical protein